MKRFFLSLAAIAMFAFSASAESPQEARLLRFPTIGGGNIAFSYAGDLYVVPENGGVARKITSDVGYECFPKISPDGKTIAFTAQYDGNTEVYTIPVEGGSPKRLTYSALVARDKVGERMGPNNIVMGWTPDGKKVIYRSKQWCFSGLRGSLCLVDAEGGLPEVIPTSEGGFCSFSPDGKKLAMNRMFREFRTWKYYRGGQADDIWINTVGSNKLEKITDNDAQDIFPMWIGNEIYYLSDRDRTMNLFVYDTKDGKTRKATEFSDYDCKFPAASDKAIVFENGGYIWRYDIASGSASKVSIRLQDDGALSRDEYKSGLSGLTTWSLSPDGKSVIAVVRGDIFTLPAGAGAVKNLSRSSSSHEREACFSPDGKTIAWTSDKSGEYQIYTAPADKPAEERCLTSFANGYPASLLWSPDSKKLYFTTGKRDLLELDVESGALKTLLTGRSAIRGFSLSSDGSYATYSTALDNDMSGVFILDMAKGKSHQISDRWFDATSPIFSADGKYLFFTSSRDYRSQYSAVEWNASYNVSDYVYVLPLTLDCPDPTSLKKAEEPAAKAEGDKKKEEAPSAMKVDFENIGRRISRLPLQAGRYRLLFSDKDKLYYIAGQGVKALDLKTLQESEVQKERPLALSYDHKKALVRDKNSYKIADFGGPAAKGAEIKVDEISLMIDHHAEWAQIFDESWRITRDGFYVENMHGADWSAIRSKYGCMLPYVNHREDLSYLIGEMLGELNVGHAYITSGETVEVKRIPTGLLGARYSKASSGAFRIEKIFEDPIWDEKVNSPLAQAGVDAKVGDYLIEIDGIPCSVLSDPGQALIGKAGKTVELKLASDAAGKKNPRSVLVKPVADESQLAYYEWVKRNMEMVEKLSDGQIGYIHIPDMSTEGLDMFTKMYYSQLDKKALIIDDRMNGGGNVSPMILERLQREVYRVSMYRNGANKPVPNEAFYGPMVCLIDKYSSSDGDLFPYGFRKLGLGKLIGKRSWGGIVGISGSKSFVDGQDMRTPFFTSYSTEGEWIIEGHGVDPDIDVDINPFDDYLGKDAQISKAVEVLKEELKAWKELPGTPAAPVKN